MVDIYKMYECPKSIYKYLDFEGAVKTLEKRAVKLSRPSDFNDPLDLYIEESLGSDVQEFTEDMKHAFHDFISGDINHESLRDSSKKDAIIRMNQAFQSLLDDKGKLIKKEILETPVEDLYDFERLEKVNRDTVTALQESFQTFGIFCSTSDQANLLMWAHYADEHKGIVIEINPKIERDSVFLASKPVQYSDTRPLLYRSATDMVRLRTHKNHCGFFGF